MRKGSGFISAIVSLVFVIGLFPEIAVAESNDSAFELQSAGLLAAGDPIASGV